MSAPGLLIMLTHWEVRRQAAMAAADSASRHGRPALPHLRAASRAQARLGKLMRLANRAGTLGGSAA